MNFEVQNKWYDGKNTNVVIKGDNPFTLLQVTLEGDKLQETNEKLIELGLDYAFKAMYVDRAMPEAIQKVEEYTSKIEEMNKVIVEAKGLLEKVKTESETSQLTLLETLGQISTIDERVKALESK